MLRIISQETHNAETIIISDSNSVFIEEILQHHGLDRLVAKVFTNPAKFEENDEGNKVILKIEPFTQVDPEKSKGDYSPKNMCKGDILEDYIAKRKEEGNDKPATSLINQ